MYLKRKDWRFDGPECGADCGPCPAAAWRFLDKCISCDDALRNTNETPANHVPLDDREVRDVHREVASIAPSPPMPPCMQTGR